MTTLYLIRGVSGSGKTSLAVQLYNQGVVTAVLEADSYFYDADGNYNFNAANLGAAHMECQKEANRALFLGRDVAVSNTSTPEKEVEVYRKIAENNCAKFISIVVENRHGGKNQHDVPPEKLEQMRKRFSIKL